MNQNTVMAGLVPAIHAFSGAAEDVDTSDMRRHDCEGLVGVRHVSCSHKSFQFGLFAMITRAFRARGQCFIVFSR